MSYLRKKIKEIAKYLPFQIGYRLQLCRYRLTIKNKFYKLHGYKLNISEPVTFSDKIFYRKYYGNFETMSFFADKLRVRDYVSQKVDEDILIPLLGKYKILTLNDLDKLPNQFVLKTNHGSGSDHIEIVRDKSRANLSLICSKMNNALKEPFGYSGDERFYSLMDRYIIAEKYLANDDSDLPDFKFHCFKGHEPYIAVDCGRFKEHKRGVFDVNWNLTDIEINDTFKPLSAYPKPKNLAKMIEIASSLSEGFDYIRVDLYNVNGKLYFGELTQTPANGMETIKPLHYAYKLGAMWKLDCNNEYLYRSNR